MKKKPESAEELKTIRKIMEESSKFLSLSGVSGVFIGSYAIAGALIAYFLILDSGRIHFDEYFRSISSEGSANILWQLIIDALSVMLLSLLTAFYFSFRKVKRTGKRFLTPVSKRLMINLLIPLATGGSFVIILLIHNHIQLVIPGLLIFYGLALVNASKFTYNEVFYLGVFEIITGLISAFSPAHGLLFWTLGFGLLHIIYGLFMYRKYEA